MIGFSHAAATDMPFSGMLTIAMVCAAVVLGLTRNENTPDTPENAVARPPSLRFFPRPRRPRKRPSGRHPQRRCRLFLGALHKTLARCFPLVSSRCSRLVLRHCTPLVHPLRPPQPRFLPHLHHRTQFQALPHPRIPAHPAVLVLRPYSLVALLPWTAVSLWDPVSGIVTIAGRSAPHRPRRFASLRGCVLLSCFLHHFKIQTAWLHSSCHPAIILLSTRRNRASL